MHLDWEQSGNGDWEHWEHFLFRFSISPFQPAALPIPISFPSLRTQTPRGTNLVCLCPLRLRLVDALLENLGNRRILLVCEPRPDDFFPGVAFVSLFLLIRSEFHQIGTVQPPGLAGLESRFRFCPKLISIAAQRFNIDSSTRDRPESPASGLVAQIATVVNSAREDALPRTPPVAFRMVDGNDQWPG